MGSTHVFQSKYQIIVFSNWFCYYKLHFVKMTNFFVNKMYLFKWTEIFSQFSWKKCILVHRIESWSFQWEFLIKLHNIRIYGFNKYIIYLIYGFLIKFDRRSSIHFWIKLHIISQLTRYRINFTAIVWIKFDLISFIDQSSAEHWNLDRRNSISF